MLVVVTICETTPTASMIQYIMQNNNFCDICLVYTLLEGVCSNSNDVNEKKDKSNFAQIVQLLNFKKTKAT